MNEETEMKEEENPRLGNKDGDHGSGLVEAPGGDGPDIEYKQDENYEDIKPPVAVFLQSIHEDDEEEEEETICEEEEVKPPVAVFLQSTHEEEEEETICEADPLCVIVEKSSFDEEDMFTSGAEDREEAVGMSSYYTSFGNCEELSGAGGAKPPVAARGHYRRREAREAPVCLKPRCGLCGKTFVQNSQLEKHMLVAHSKDKAYECTICKQRFSDCGTRSRHVRVVHSGERQHRCEECGKSFAQAYHLITHLRSHSGEKPFECTVCKRSFTRHEHVVRHMVLHSGEKPYECEVCGKKFSHSGHLSAHYRVHSGERPYTCTVCNKSFTVRGNLSRHMRLH